MWRRAAAPECQHVRSNIHQNTCSFRSKERQTLSLRSTPYAPGRRLHVTRGIVSFPVSRIHRRSATDPNLLCKGGGGLRGVECVQILLNIDLIPLGIVSRQRGKPSDTRPQVISQREFGISRACGWTAIELEPLSAGNSPAPNQKKGLPKAFHKDICNVFHLEVAGRQTGCPRLWFATQKPFLF